MWIGKIIENDYGRLNLYVNGNGVTEQFYDALNSSPAQQNGYSCGTARLTAENAIGNIAVSFWVQNLFDREYFTSIFNTDASLNFSYAQRGLPRTYGLQATYRFGKDYETPPEVRRWHPPRSKRRRRPRSSKPRRHSVSSSVLRLRQVGHHPGCRPRDPGRRRCGEGRNVVKITVTGHTDTVDRPSTTRLSRSGAPPR